MTVDDSNSCENDEQDRNDTADGLPHRIIVIGASAGGFEAIKKIVKGLPAEIPASIFIVWHMAASVRGVLPNVLNNLNTIYAAHAFDGEEIKPNRIYVAVPDHHLIVEEGKVRVTRGPKENRFRPAVDPLFRSAAYAYGQRVIGIILSGALDDGTAGLWQVKHYGGVTIVQDPADAEISSMPESAIRGVSVDYCVPVSAMADLLVRLCKEHTPENVYPMKDQNTKIEIDIASEKKGLERSSLTIGDLTAFTCPECHGVLSRIMDGKLFRFRCHTGHAYSPDALMAAVTEKIEDSLYNVIRGIDESVILLNHMGDHFAEANQLKLAALYFNKAQQAVERSNFVWKAVLTHEQLTQEKLLQESSENGSETV